MSKCKYCQNNFDVSDKPKNWMANHTRWCNDNPKRKIYTESLKKARSKKTNFKNQYSYGAICSESTKAKIGIASAGRKHSQKTKELIREKALKSPHRRLKKNVINYKGILLDSSWELELAKRLDFLGIMWSRPEPLPWTDNNGIIHNYFPDFYLPDYNLYLDPKNPHAYKVQQNKINCLMEQYNNIIILDSLQKCKKFII